MVRIGSQKAQPCELVNGGILVQTQLRVSDTPSGYDLHIYLDPLTRIGHLLIGHRFVHFFLHNRRKQSQFAHDSV